MFDYNHIVGTNNSLKGNPFLNHITITKVQGDYVYFNDGKSYCTLENLLNSLVKGQGYVTNISLLKPAIEAYNNKLKKQERHAKLQKDLKQNIKDTRDNRYNAILDRLKQDRIADGIKKEDLVVVKNQIADKALSLFGEVDVDALDYYMNKVVMNKVDGEDNYICRSNIDTYPLANTKQDIDYVKYFLFMVYIGHYIGYLFEKKYGKKLYSIASKIYKEDGITCHYEKDKYSSFLDDIITNLILFLPFRITLEGGKKYYDTPYIDICFYDWLNLPQDYKIEKDKEKKASCYNYYTAKGKYASLDMLKNVKFSLYFENVDNGGVDKKFLESIGVPYKEDEYGDVVIFETQGLNNVIQFCKDLQKAESSFREKVVPETKKNSSNTVSVVELRNKVSILAEAFIQKYGLRKYNGKDYKVLFNKTNRYCVENIRVAESINDDLWQKQNMKYDSLSDYIEEELDPFITFMSLGGEEDWFMASYKIHEEQYEIITDVSCVEKFPEFFEKTGLIKYKYINKYSNSVDIKIKGTFEEVLNKIMETDSTYVVVDRKGSKYGIEDTKDGTIEYYTLDEIYGIQAMLGVNIIGIE